MPSCRRRSRPPERDRLRRSGVKVRVSVEPSANGVYKSFAYEIFKRRASLLLAFDGKSPAANLVQEAKNGRAHCDIYLDGRARALRAKAQMLEGYVRLLQDLDDPAQTLLDDLHGIFGANLDRFDPSCQASTEGEMPPTAAN